MKVLALVTDAYGGYGGIAQYNRDLLSALRSLKRVHELIVLPRMADKSDLNVPEGIAQHPPVANKYKYALRALRTCASLRPDLIFNGHVYHGPLAGRLGRMFRSPVLSQLHGTEVWEPLARKHLEPLEQSTCVLCVSEDTKARYDRQAPAAGNGRVLHNTVSPIFRVGNRSAARTAFQLDGKFSILTVSRLDCRDGYKGHDRVIRMMPRILEQHPAAEYVIAGDGPDKDRLAKLSAEVGVSNQVRFLGRVPAEDLPRLYNAVDLFALPSTGEGFGIVYLEATSCGTPAIGLAMGGAPDALFHPAYCKASKSDEFQDDLLAMIRAAIGMQHSDREALSQATHARFGAEVFRQRVAAALEQAVDFRQRQREPADGS